MFKSNALVLILLVSFATQLSAKEIRLSNTKTLYFKVPATFQFKISRDRSDKYQPSLRFTSYNRRGRKKLGFKIFIHKDKTSQLRYTSQEIAWFKAACAQHQAGSVENKVTLQVYRDANNSQARNVYYCTFTDSQLAKRGLKPGSGQYLHITTAFVHQQNYVFRAIAYSNKVTGNLYLKFLKVMSSIKISNR